MLKTATTAALADIAPGDIAPGDIAPGDTTPGDTAPAATTDPRAEELSLVRRAQGGDAEAFGELYRRNVGRIFAVCLRMVRDRRRAEDLTQDAFVRAWQKLGQFQGKSLFSSWLHRLTVNLVLGQGRSRTRRLAKVTPVENLEAVEASAAPPTPPAAAASGVDLERAIAALPPRARQVFVLHDIEGFRHDEIARLSAMAVGTSKAHLHRARRSLRQLLSTGHRGPGAILGESP